MDSKSITEAIGAGIAIILLAGIVLALPVQLLWNGCLVGAVDGVHPITFLQALGLNILFSILFKSSK
jgi:hypothetical protein